jgi:zinc protease
MTITIHRTAILTTTALALAACPRPAVQTVAAPDPVARPTAPVVTTPDRPAPPAPARATKVRTVEGIDEYRLDNGLQVLLFPDPSESTVTVNITYFVGSKHEGAGETGMAHLLEHMLFKGTPTHRNVLKLLDERGGFPNGTTWTDRTNYFETLPASDDNLLFAIGLEADRMINATISPDDLATEFSVVRNEMEAGENQPADILEEKMTATAYVWHNYGKSTIGARSDVEKVPADKLRVFYSTYYQPDNALLVVSGNFDGARALAEIERTFGAIPRPTRTLPPQYTVEPVQDGERHVVLRRTGDVQVIAAMYHAVGGAHPDFAATQAVHDALIREPSGRLYKALVEAGVVARLSGRVYQFKDPTVMIVLGQLAAGKQTATASAKMLSVIEGLAKAPITAEEVERWRAAALKGFHLAMSDSTRIAIAISEWAALGDWRLIFAHRDRVKAVTVDDVNRVAVDYLKTSNRTSGEFIPTENPDRAPLPDVPNVAKIAANLEPGPAFPVGEAFDASIDNLVERVERRELAGGITAAFLPKQTRGDTVRLQLTLHVGDEKTLAGKLSLALLTARLVERGSKTRTYQQVADEKDKLMATVSIAGDRTEITASVVTVREHLPAVIDLVADLMKRPRLDAKELEILRRAAISQLETRRKDPEWLGFIELDRKQAPWPKGDVREVLTIDQRIANLKKVTRTQVAQFHKEFWGAGRGELVVIGDFDPAEVTTKIESQFGTWKTRRPYTRIADKLFDVPGSELTVDTKDKAMMLVVAGHGFAMKDDHPDYPALIVASHIFGGGTGSRLWMRLREKEGISYGTWGGFGAAAQDAVGSFYLGAILAPMNMSRTKAAIKEEIAKVVDTGATDTEVEVARKAWVEQFDNLVADDASLVWRIAADLDNGRDLSYDRSLRERVAAVTTADVNRVFKTYLDPSKVTLVVAGDLSAAGKTDGPTK